MVQRCPSRKVHGPHLATNRYGSRARERAHDYGKGGQAEQLRCKKRQLYNSKSLKMGYNSGPSGTTDNPILNPQIKKKKHLAPVSKRIEQVGWRARVKARYKGRGEGRKRSMNPSIQGKDSDHSSQKTYIFSGFSRFFCFFCDLPALPHIICEPTEPAIMHDMRKN
jgi:hypothetical protein